MSISTVTKLGPRFGRDRLEELFAALCALRERVASVECKILCGAARHGDGEACSRDDGRRPYDTQNDRGACGESPPRGATVSGVMTRRAPDTDYRPDPEHARHSILCDEHPRLPWHPGAALADQSRREHIHEIRRDGNAQEEDSSERGG
jgi:hypothetical protein